MTPEAVARIVERRNEAAFVDLLRSADLEFEDDAGFEPALADALRAEPQLTELWTTWSADQRWTPSAYVEGNETGWYDLERQHAGSSRYRFRGGRLRPPDGRLVGEA